MLLALKTLNSTKYIFFKMHCSIVYLQENYISTFKIDLKSVTYSGYYYVLSIFEKKKMKQSWFCFSSMASTINLHLAHSRMVKFSLGFVFLFLFFVTLASKTEEALNISHQTLLSWLTIPSHNPFNSKSHRENIFMFYQLILKNLWCL